MANDSSAIRSVTLDVYLGEDAADLLPTIRASIARYRAGCRQLFGVFACAQAAGASVVESAGDISLKPSNDRAREILRSVFAVDGPAKAPAYPCRRWFLDDLYPGALSFVWDSARQQVWDRWKAKDPEFTRAGRGWLVLQGARHLTQFRGVGIEFPQVTARPKLNDRSITLKWDHEIGAVEFQLGKLDPGRWHTWRQVRDGSWEPGTLTLNERDGRLRVTISYHRNEIVESIDPTRTLAVEFQTAALVMTGPDGEIDAVPLTDLTAKLSQLRALREMWEGRRESTGSPRRSWGNRRAFTSVQKHLERVTLNRSRFVADQNHAISRRMAARASMWWCGIVSLTIPVAKSLAGHSWAWDQLENFARYKLEEVGATLTIKDAALESPILTGFPRA